jgi:hypothetical protein
LFKQGFEKIAENKAILKFFIAIIQHQADTALYVKKKIRTRASCR